MRETKHRFHAHDGNTNKLLIRNLSLASTAFGEQILRISKVERMYTFNLEHVKKKVHIAFYNVLENTGNKILSCSVSWLKKQNTII